MTTAEAHRTLKILALRNFDAAAIRGKPGIVVVSDDTIPVDRGDGAGWEWRPSQVVFLGKGQVQDPVAKEAVNGGFDDWENGYLGVYFNPEGRKSGIMVFDYPRNNKSQ